MGDFRALFGSVLELLPQLHCETNHFQTQKLTKTSIYSDANGSAGLLGFSGSCPSLGAGVEGAALLHVVGHPGLSPGCGRVHVCSTCPLLLLALVATLSSWEEGQECKRQACWRPISVLSANILWGKASCISKSNVNGGRRGCAPTVGEVTAFLKQWECLFVEQ